MGAAHHILAGWIAALGHWRPVPCPGIAVTGRNSQAAVNYITSLRFLLIHTMQQEPFFAALKAAERLPPTSLQWQLDQTPGRGITNSQSTNLEALNKCHHLLQSVELLVKDSAPDVSKEEKDIPALPWRAIPCSISLPAPTLWNTSCFTTARGPKTALPSLQAKGAGSSWDDRWPDKMGAACVVLQLSDIHSHFILERKKKPKQQDLLQ